MIIKQLTPRLGKLLEETMSVFWVDLGYRSRSRKRVPLQGSRGVTDTQFCSYSFYMLPDYLAVGPDSAPGVWAVVPGMYGAHLKYGQCLQPISFNNLGPRLTRVIGVVWDASIIGGNWCSLT